MSKREYNEICAEWLQPLMPTLANKLIDCGELTVDLATSWQLLELGQPSSTGNSIGTARKIISYSLAVTLTTKTIKPILNRKTIPLFDR